MTEKMTPSLLLKMKASTPQEMDILSTLLQDALLPKTAFAYNKKEKQAHLLLNRFCWEHMPHRRDRKILPIKSSKPYYRVHTGVYFHDVDHVWVNTIFKRHPIWELLNLLTIHADEKNDVNLIFSGGAHIRLSMKQCCAHLKDLHDGWPTYVKPHHVS
ncbi:MAG: DUF2948 family protein [Holosporales bacterium]|jgi:hypothetical protein|nr:DUF2948 family protein [Holosporales bacterium]